MKKLVLIRHAKSSWDNLFLADHQRPLSERGLRNAPEMGARLKANHITPELLITSDAERARQTAEITAGVLGLSDSLIVLKPNLYHASASTILKTIQQTERWANTLFVFGHNPGLNDLVNQLGYDLTNLPTCGQVGFHFNVSDWADVSPKNAKYWFFDYPKSKFTKI